MKIRLTTHQKQLARTIASINNISEDRALALVARRISRRATKPTFTGSVAKAQSYAIL